MRNGQIAAGLREIADLLEMTEENVFRIRAYR
ncbi:MAG: DNA-binding protein, partial [Chloroflexota bacterium]